MGRWAYHLFLKKIPRFRIRLRSHRWASESTWTRSCQLGYSSLRIIKTTLSARFFMMSVIAFFVDGPYESEAVAVFSNWGLVSACCSALNFSRGPTVPCPVSIVRTTEEISLLPIFEYNSYDCRTSSTENPSNVVWTPFRFLGVVHCLPQPSGYAFMVSIKFRLGTPRVRLHKTRGCSSI